MGGSGVVKLACVLVICMVVAGGEAAISCGQLASALTPCLPYLKNGGAKPPAACCGGVKKLSSAAKTTADRKAACTCLKGLSKSYSGVNYGLASGLPGKCGVSIPYKISPSTDCSKYVHPLSLSLCVKLIFRYENS